MITRMLLLASMFATIPALALNIDTLPESINVEVRISPVELDLLVLPGYHSHCDLMLTPVPSLHCYPENVADLLRRALSGAGQGTAR